MAITSNQNIGVMAITSNQNIGSNGNYLIQDNMLYIGTYRTIGGQYMAYNDFILFRLKSIET